MKTQAIKELLAEMRAVARGEIPAPADAAMPSEEPGVWPVMLDDQQWQSDD